MLILFRTAFSFTKKQTTSMLVTMLVVASLFPFAIPVKPIEVYADSPTTIVPYLATEYKFKVVAFDEEPGFEQPGFDDSEFSLGDAGFGTQSGFCSMNNPTDAKTPWPLFTDILLRKEFSLPAGASDLKVAVAIDNDIQVFINGEDISGGLVLHEGCPALDSFVFSAPDSILNEGENLLAVRAKDRGVLSYVDVKVTAVTGEGVPSYTLELFDDGKIIEGPVGFGEPVTAVAKVENDPDVTQVEFRWIACGNLAYSSTIPLVGGMAEDIQQVFPCRDVREFGDAPWVVEADFGNGQAVQKELFFSFFVLPESPIGAVAMILSSVGALGGFLYFRSRKPPVS